MARLSEIFESVETQSSYDIKRRKYFSDKLIESYYLTENLKKTDNMSIENELFLEAISYGDEEKAFKFLEAIETSVLKEGVFGSIKKGFDKAKNWAKDKVKKVVKKVKRWFRGPIIKKFDAFNSAISAAANKLIQNGLKESTDESLVQYLIESEGGNPPPSGGGEGDPPNAGGEKVDKPVGTIDGMAKKLFAGTKVPTGKPTGLQNNVKFYAISKSGTDIALWVGPSKELKDMKLLASFEKSSSKLTINLDKTVVTNAKDMKLISNLILAIKLDESLNPDGVLGDIRQSSAKVTVTHNGTPTKPFLPGKRIIMRVGGKIKAPIKVIGALEHLQFQNSLAIQKPTDSGPPEEETNTPPTGEPLDEKQWISKIIKDSGVMQSESRLIEILKIDSASLWSNFAKFAARNNNDLPSILLSTSGRSDYSPMSPEEFMTYAANIDTFIGYIRKAVASGKLDTQNYDKPMFLEFLNIALPAAIQLSKDINGLVSSKQTNAAADDAGEGETGTGEEQPNEEEKKPERDPKTPRKNNYRNKPAIPNAPPNR